MLEWWVPLSILGPIGRAVSRLRTWSAFAQFIKHETSWSFLSPLVFCASLIQSTTIRLSSNNLLTSSSVPSLPSHLPPHASGEIFSYSLERSLNYFAGQTAPLFRHSNKNYPQINILLVSISEILFLRIFSKSSITCSLWSWTRVEFYCRTHTLGLTSPYSQLSPTEAGHTH